MRILHNLLLKGHKNEMNNFSLDELQAIINASRASSICRAEKKAQNGALIEKLQTVVLLTARRRSTARRFVKMLENESCLYDHFDAFQAGMDCFTDNEPSGSGFIKYIASLDKKLSHKAYYRKLQKTFQKLLEQMPDEKTRLCLEQLEIIYRETYSVHQRTEDMFMAGYDYKKSSGGLTIKPAVRKKKACKQLECC